MDDADALDPDLAGLVIQLCKRIAMNAEDIDLLAINASSDLEERVAAVTQAVSKMGVLAQAAEALIALTSCRPGCDVWNGAEKEQEARSKSRVRRRIDEKPTPAIAAAGPAVDR